MTHLNRKDREGSLRKGNSGDWEGIFLLNLPWTTIKMSHILSLFLTCIVKQKSPNSKNNYYPEKHLSNQSIFAIS